MITAGGRWGHRAQSGARAWLAKPRAQALSCLLLSADQGQAPVFFSRLYGLEHAAPDGCEWPLTAEPLLRDCTQPRELSHSRSCPLDGWAPWLGLVAAEFKGWAPCLNLEHLGPECPVGPAEASAETASQFNFSLCSALPPSPLPWCSPELFPVNLLQADLCPGTCFPGARPEALPHQEACSKACVCPVGMGSLSLPYRWGDRGPEREETYPGAHGVRGRSRDARLRPTRSTPPFDRWKD